MSYSDLTEGEQAHWNEYTNLRQISDWPGFDAAQDQRRADSRTWLQDRRQYIKDCAEGKVEGQKKGWDVSNRKARYDFLQDKNLNSGAPKHEVRLPCSATATNAEKSYIEEREIWMWVQSTTDEQKARKQACTDWLIARRKQLWHNLNDAPVDTEGNKKNDRQTRYENLCIATRHGSYYETWDKNHNKWGQPYSTNSSSNKRQAICDWLDEYVGTSENPKGSNKGSPQPSKWQQRVYGDDGVPWCACFSVCSAWDQKISGSGTASVYQNVQLAKKGQGIYKGWTSDPKKVQKGDHMFIGSDHTGVARGTYQSNGTILGVEGNTSGTTSSGSQWNGDVVAKKSRSASYWSAGFGIVRAD